MAHIRSYSPFKNLSVLGHLPPNQEETHRQLRAYVQVHKIFSLICLQIIPSPLDAVRPFCSIGMYFTDAASALVARNRIGTKEFFIDLFY